jgi:transcription elongation factor Elf1
MEMNKIILYTSIVLNGILLMVLLGALPFFLYLSIIFNVAFLWLVKKSLEKEQSYETEITRVVEKIESFSDHLDRVHELEMYYGDENLHSLMEHSTQLINDFIDFQAKFFDVDVEELEEEYYEQASAQEE